MFETLIQFVRRHSRFFACAGIFFLAVFFLLAGIAYRRAQLISPDSTYFLRDRHGRFLGEVGAPPDGEYGYWRLEEMPKRIAAATLAVEDRRFQSHPGVDPLAVIRAAYQNVIHLKRVSGASTIAMQIARMQNPGRRGYWRKATEALTALIITGRYSRDEILSHYFRIIPYGNRIHGISYAARRYLDKPVEDLSWAETAFLAAIPQTPKRMNPFSEDGRQRAAIRGKRILELLYRDKTINREEFDLACLQIKELHVPRPGIRPEEAMHALLQLEGILKNKEAHRLSRYRYIITTSLDLDLQNEISYITAESVAGWEAQGARNAAAIVVDRESNEILSWVGSTGYFNKTNAGAIDYSALPRSPGSALKPFFYALALENREITPATILNDLERGPGGMVNSDATFMGPMLPRVALANSRNVPAADILEKIGIERGYGLLRTMGLHDGSAPADRYGVGLAIGNMPVTLEKVVRAYSVLSRDGILNDLVWFEGQKNSESRRILSEETTRQIALFLSDPMARLPGFARMSALEFPFPVAIKTGTSSNFRDAWAVAYSSRYLVGAWVGDPDYQPMNRLTGSASAAELVKKILTYLQADETKGLNDLSFPSPRGYKEARICALTGDLAVDACDRVFTEWFRPTEIPIDNCRAHIRLAIDTRTGRPATRITPGEYVEVKTFVDLPPIYGEWAVAAGINLMPKKFDLSSFASREPESTPFGDKNIRMSIISPENGLRLIPDPETPADQSTVALRAAVNPVVPQLLWYVDGKPFKLADYPYTSRLNLTPGEHIIQAGLPNSPVTSGRVKIIVQ